jgi:hypothetical protein
MPVQVNTLISEVQTILKENTDFIGDPTNLRWDRAELLGWLNAGYREIVGLRPDATSTAREFLCEAGTRQRLLRDGAGCEDAWQLLEVVRNTASSSQKGAVRPTQRADLDNMRRYWHAAEGTTDIEYAIVEPTSPREFLVYPPASSDARLEVVVSVLPQSHSTQLAATSSEVIRLPDPFSNALSEWILYKAFSKDADFIANAERAVLHRTAMQASLGLGGAG